MLTEILRLPVDEPEAGADAEWGAEIERRGAEVDAGTADTMTLEEYREHVRRRRAARAPR